MDKLNPILTVLFQVVVFIVFYVFLLIVFIDLKQYWTAIYCIIVSHSCCIGLPFCDYSHGYLTALSV